MNVKQVTERDLLSFYQNLFVGTNTNYGYIRTTHAFCPIQDKLLVLPYPFLKIVQSKPMQLANHKIQTAHCYKKNPRMDDTRLDHMIFAESLGVDLLTILEEKGYVIDNPTKIAFLVFLLTHDIGHGPFSHPFEGMVDGYKGMHEDIGRRVLLENLKDILEDIYPGLTERVIHFSQYDTYGLSSLLEGIFDLDRAAFLIMDTFLMDEEGKYQAFEDVTQSIYQIMQKIILQDGKVYYDISALPYIDTFLRIRTTNYQENYQSRLEVLDDLILKRIGTRAIQVMQERQDKGNLFPPHIKKEIENFVSFIQTMKKEKANIDLSLYYSFQDDDFERIFHFLLLLDDPILNLDCLFMISPRNDYEKFYEIIEGKEKIEGIDFYVENKVTIYRSTNKENITFLKNGNAIDFQDCPNSFHNHWVIQKNLSYQFKNIPKLSQEEELRDMLWQELDSKLQEETISLSTYETIRPSDEEIIKPVQNYLNAIKVGISHAEYRKRFPIGDRELLVYLSCLNLGESIKTTVRMLLAPHLGYYYTEEEASLKLKHQQKKMSF